MAGEEQYINPIIQAMQMAQQRQQQQQNLALETQRVKQEGAYQQATTDRLAKQLDLEHELHKRTLEEVTIPQLQAQLAAQRLQQVEGMNQAHAQGVTPAMLAAMTGGTYNPGDQSKSYQQIPGVQTPPGQGPGASLSFTPVGAKAPISLNPDTDLESPAAYLQRLAAQAQAPEAGKQAAEEPGKVAASARSAENQKALETQRVAAEKEAATAKAAVDEELENIKSRAAMKRTLAEQAAENQRSHERNGVQLRIAGYSEDPEKDSARIQAAADLAETGKYPATLNPAKGFDSQVLGVINQRGTQQVDKKVPEQLKRTNDLIDAYGKMQDYISQLPEGSIGGLLRGAAIKAPFSNEAKGEFQSLQSNVLKIGKEVQDNSGGRTNIKQLGFEENSIPTENDSRPVAQKKIQKLLSAALTLRHDVILGGIGQDQTKKLYQSNGIKEPQIFKDSKTGHTVVSYDNGATVYDYNTGEKQHE